MRRCWREASGCVVVGMVVGRRRLCGHVLGASVASSSSHLWDCGEWEVSRGFQTNRPTNNCQLQEGDSVVIGESEFEWKDDRSEGALYSAWLADLKARGATRQGVARWPAATQPRD